MHKQHAIYGPLVHASGVHGGLSMVHVGPRIWKMADNGRKCARGMYPTWTGVCPRIGIKSYVSNNPVGVDQTPLDLGMAGPPSEPMIWNWPKSPTR